MADVITDIHWAAARTVPPTSEPVTVAEVKEQARISHSDEDALIARYIKLGREEAELFARRQFMLATWALILDDLPSDDSPIALPYPPLAGVTSIVYLDSDGVSQTMVVSEYRVDTSSEPGRVSPAYGTSWPATYDVTGAITITYTAGAATAAAVLERYKQAVLLLAVEMFETREPMKVEANSTVARLLRPDRDYRFS